MYKRTLFIILLIFSIQEICISQKNNFNIQDNNDQRKIKTIKQVAFLPIERNGEIIKGEKVIDFFNLQVYQDVKNNYGETLISYKHNLDQNLTKTFVYNYNNEQKPIDFIEYYSNINSPRKKIITFNENQNVNEEIQYYPNGDIMFEVYYKYDNNGNKIEEFRKNSKRLNKDRNRYEREFHHSFEYNNQGCLVIKNEYKKNRKINSRNEYYYNSNEKIIESKKLSARGKLKEYKLYNYNDEGEIIEKKTFNKNKILIEVCIYNYYENNKGYEFTLNDYENKELLSSSGRKYDNFGNLIEETISIPDFGFSNTKSFQYVYDKYNNWTTKIQFTNHKAKYIFEREIEYLE